MICKLQARLALLHTGIDATSVCRRSLDLLDVMLIHSTAASLKLLLSSGLIGERVIRDFPVHGIYPCLHI